jgi:hypothetical protein
VLACALFSHSTPPFLSYCRQISFFYTLPYLLPHDGTLSPACDVSLYPLILLPLSNGCILHPSSEPAATIPPPTTYRDLYYKYFSLTSPPFVSIHVHLFPPFQVPTYCLQSSMCNILRQCISYGAPGPTCISPPHTQVVCVCVYVCVSVCVCVCVCVCVYFQFYFADCTQIAGLKQITPLAAT